jgi:hypothetical protein
MKRKYTVMVNNSSNVNEINNHLLAENIDIQNRPQHMALETQVLA